MISRLEDKFAHSPALPLLTALLVNGIALLLSSNYVDGDAHTRTYMAIRWLQNPFFITSPNDVTWVFGPLHCYLNAAALSIWYNPPLTPRLLSWLLSSLTILPLYYGLRIVFNSKAAFYSALLFCFYTLYIHAAAISVSEGINLFFVFLSIWLFLRYLRAPSWVTLLPGAVAMLAATMIRYDSWPLATLLSAYLAVTCVTSPANKETLRIAWVQVIAFGAITHSFAMMWLAVSWIEFTDPLMFMHYSGNLDAPVIADKIAEMGRLKFFLYNTAFLPGVMFLSLSATTFFLGLAGVWKTLRSNPGNLFLLALWLYVVFYLVTFVFSFERFPLARFTVIPGAFLLCFSGVGLMWIADRLKGRATGILKATAIAFPIVSVIVLGQFSQPSANSLKEKLRAVSPTTQPPDYFHQTASFFNERLAGGQVLALDCRNYNDRLLYLHLWIHHDRIQFRWSDTDSLAAFVESTMPDFVLHTAVPNRNHELFRPGIDGPLTSIAGIPYKIVDRYGIFTICEIVR